MTGTRLTDHRPRSTEDPPRPQPGYHPRMLPIEDAWSRLREHLRPTPSINVRRDRTNQRVVARDISATLDVPPYDTSAMDGFALPSDPAQPAPVAVVLAAGDEPGALLADGGAGTVARIMTGAPVPADCDRVVPVELASVQGDEKEGELVTFTDTGNSGQHIRRRGEVSTVGAPLIAAGTPVSAATTSLLATHGIDDVPVHAPPTVAFATTGNEIVPPETEPGPGQLRDSHSDFFCRVLNDLALPHQSLGIVPDDPAALRQTIQEGLRSDVLLLSGGVSKGEFDFVEDVLAEFGCTSIFDSVAIQPGKPVVAAHHPGGLVFGLPGNPASAQVCFWLFVRPALRILLGYDDAPWAGARSATLGGPLPRAKGRDRFLPCQLEDGTDGLVAHPLPPKGSHDVVAYGLVDGLVRIPAGSAPGEAGQTCSVLALPG